MTTKAVTLEEKVQVIDSFIEELIKETGIVRDKLKGSSCVRTLALLSFATLEVVANYRSLYRGEKEGNKEKVIKRIDQFFLTEQNSHLSDLPHYKSITSEDIYEIRCSTVHFFSCVSKTTSQKSISIVDGDERKIPNIYKDLGIIYISNMSLHILILEGVKLMFGKINEGIKDKKGEEGIERIYDKIQTEGAVEVKIR